MKKKNIIVISTVMLLGLTLLIGNYSYAYLRKRIDTDKKITITVGTLDYLYDVIGE